jgi:hypothetical protein
MAEPAKSQIYPTHGDASKRPRMVEIKRNIPKNIRNEPRTFTTSRAYLLTTLQPKPKPGFDWSRCTWGRPDSVPSALCSYCSASIGDDEIPLMMWNAKGFAVRFCEQ